MVFDDEKTAAAAMVKLNAGEDFYQVAQDIAKQSKEDTELGWVEKDQLIADMGEKMFSIKLNNKLCDYRFYHFIASDVLV